MRCNKFVNPLQGCNSAVMVGSKGTTGRYYFGKYSGTLYCQRPSSVMGSGFCSVTGCGCGTLRIDPADGLPVELMEFIVAFDEDTEPGSGQEEAAE